MANRHLSPPPPPLYIYIECRNIMGWRLNKLLGRVVATVFVGEVGMVVVTYPYLNACGLLGGLFNGERGKCSSNISPLERDFYLYGGQMEAKGDHKQPTHKLCQYVQRF